MSRIRVRKEDMVVVISGKDRDLTKPRRVLQVIPRKSLVLVEGAHMIKVHTKPNPQRNVKGGILERESPMHVSNVMHWDPEAKRASRIGSRRTDDGKRIQCCGAVAAIWTKGEPAENEKATSDLGRDERPVRERRDERWMKGSSK